MGLNSVRRMELVQNLTDCLKIANDKKSLLIRINLSNFVDLIQVDLSDYMDKSLLFSISQGPGNCALSILEAVKSFPHSVLMFDNTEKANDSVFQTLLKILDTGMLNDGSQLRVDFSCTTIVVTIDLGNKDARKKNVIRLPLKECIAKESDVKMLRKSFYKLFEDFSILREMNKNFRDSTPPSTYPANTLLARAMKYGFGQDVYNGCRV